MLILKPVSQISLKSVNFEFKSNLAFNSTLIRPIAREDLSTKTFLSLLMWLRYIVPDSHGYIRRMVWAGLSRAQLLSRPLLQLTSLGVQGKQIW
jgi:hypothetical protein